MAECRHRSSCALASMCCMLQVGPSEQKRVRFRLAGADDTQPCRRSRRTPVPTSVYQPPSRAQEVVGEGEGDESRARMQHKMREMQRTLKAQQKMMEQIQQQLLRNQEHIMQRQLGTLPACLPLTPPAPVGPTAPAPAPVGPTAPALRGEMPEAVRASLMQSIKALSAPDLMRVAKMMGGDASSGVLELDLGTLESERAWRLYDYCEAARAKKASKRPARAPNARAVMARMEAAHAATEHELAQVRAARTWLNTGGFATIDDDDDDVNGVDPLPPSKNVATNTKTRAAEAPSDDDSDPTATDSDLAAADDLLAQLDSDSD